MSKVFLNADFLTAFMKKEREQVISNLCEELACERETLSFMFENSESDTDALEIPRR